jgi:beta-lactamase class A
MNDRVLEDSITELSARVEGRVGVCAETLDGSRRLEIRSGEVFPTASSIKMYVLYTLLALAERGELSLADRLGFTERAAQPGSGVLFHLDPGLEPTLKDLATLMMMISDNSALIMLSDHLGIDNINTEIQDIGLRHTRFGDWSRFETDYADSPAFGVATPGEFVDFLLRMQRAELLGAGSSEIFWDILRIQKYILPLRRHLPASPWSREFNLPEPVWVASKSGMLDDCAGESGLVRVHDGGWAISIMIRETSMIGRAELAENLISDISLQVYEAWAPLFTSGEKP